MKLPRIASLHAGKVAPLGLNGVPSGFVKYSLGRPAWVTPLGISGDEQADLSVHGGLEKAVYGYSFDNYGAWGIEYPRHAAKLVPGGFGENLCIEGLREADLCVGDVHLDERPNADFSFARLVEIVSRHNATPAEWERMQNMAGLASDLQAWAVSRCGASQA